MSLLNDFPTLCLACGLAVVTHALPLAQAAEPAADRIYDVDPSTGFRMTRYRAPVPSSVPGGITLDTADLREALAGGDPVLIDVFPPKGLGPDPLDGHWVVTEGHDTLPGATWLPEVGRGHLSMDEETYFRRNLERLTDADIDRPVVFFCTADCWQSWNASKRAVDWGYTSVHWYPLGTDGWTDEGGQLVPGRPINFIDDTPDDTPDAALDVALDVAQDVAQDDDTLESTVDASADDTPPDAAADTLFPSSARIVLVEAEGTEIDIGSVTFETADDGSAAIDVEIESDAFSDHFLNMFPFRCLAEAPEWFCYLPYPYTLDNTVTADDLGDLEYQLLFVRKAASEFGIDTWNGVYYTLTPNADGGFDGALMDGDLTVLQAPPDDPDARPLDMNEFFADEAARRRFPTLIIRP